MLMRFVGTFAEIDGKQLKRVGDPIDLTPEQVEVAIEGHAQIIQDEVFRQIGFTPEELAKYGSPGGMAAAPESFLEKLAQARLAVGQQKLSAPQEVTE